METVLGSAKNYENLDFGKVMNIDENYAISPHYKAQLQLLHKKDLKPHSHDWTSDLNVKNNDFTIKVHTTKNTFCAYQ